MINELCTPDAETIRVRHGPQSDSKFLQPGLNR